MAQMNRTIFIALTAFAMSLFAQRAFAQPVELDIKPDRPDELMKDSPDGTGKVESEKAEPGDNATFNISTNNDVSSLAVGDTYSNNQSTFKVIAITTKGTAGGKFIAQRTAGKADPGQRWTKVAGAGPAMLTSTQTLLDLYLAGGPFLHPIAVLAFVTILIACNCLWVYRKGRQCPGSFIREAGECLKQGDLKRFGDLANSTRGLFAQICRAMVDRFDTSEPEDIRSRTEVVAITQVNRLRVWAKALNLIAAVAPLLGLLGTIVGMIIVFEAIGGSTGSQKAQALAAGIRVKLFSTTAALLVAVPALFLFFIFNQVLGSIVGRCEVLTEQFLHDVVRIKRNGNGKPAAEPAGEGKP
ncbi:MAG: MotA/TolQ/ExbB proton channel family protein [Phycisphaerae bacterium]|nr:MotA/TolQ/ExbB proton channel family protein [Phycisphaerae bacterium]